MNSQAKTHNIIKLAYLGWSLLYIIETVVSFYSPVNKQELAAFGDLAGLLPDQSISEISSMLNSANILVAAVVILGGWPFILWLPKNYSWVFFTFISSCFLSIAVNIWTFLFPGEFTTFATNRLLQLAYIALLSVMIKFAYKLRNESSASTF